MAEWKEESTSDFHFKSQSDLYKYKMADNSNDQNQKRPDEELNVLMAEWKEKYGLPPEEERQNFYRENPVTSAGILAGFGWAIWRVKNMNKNVGTSQGGRGVNLGSMRTYYLLETRVFCPNGNCGSSCRNCTLSRFPDSLETLAFRERLHSKRYDSKSKIRITTPDPWSWSKFAMQAKYLFSPNLTYEN